MQLNFKGQDVSKSTEKHRLTFKRLEELIRGKEFTTSYHILHVIVIWVIAPGCTDYVRPLDSFLPTTDDSKNRSFHNSHEFLHTIKISMVR